MIARTLLVAALAGLAAMVAVPAPARAQAAAADRHFPDVEDNELLVLAGLETGRGDLVRYSLRRGFGYNVAPTARIVQAEWSYAGEALPRIVSVEFAQRDGAWYVAERREALMHPLRFDRLVRNVAAAVSVVSERDSRGTIMVCSHSDSSRLDLRLPDQQALHLVRTAHCSDDAPAVVAGELLIAAIDLSLRLDWAPEPGSRRVR